MQSKSDFKSKWGMANDPDTSTEVLDTLSGDVDWIIRSAVAKKP